jgi:hypothetical protein
LLPQDSLHSAALTQTAHEQQQAQQQREWKLAHLRKTRLSARLVRFLRSLTE